MSGSLNSFSDNLKSSFGNLNAARFDELYKEVLKEKAKRLIGKESAISGNTWMKVDLSSIIFVSNKNAVVQEDTWNLTIKDEAYIHVGPDTYSHGYDYAQGRSHVQIVGTGLIRMRGDE